MVSNGDVALGGMADPRDVIDDVGYAAASRDKRRLRLNLAWICLTWVFTFTAYSGLQNLETSLVPEYGVYSLAAITGGGLVSCILAPAFIAKIGAKQALIFSWVCLGLFVASNYNPKEYLLIPGAAIEGLSTGLMWTAQGAFVTTIAMEYSDIIGESLEVVLSRFFGIFCMAFQSTQVWGNVISSAVLHQETGNAPAARNSSLPPPVCGADACHSHMGPPPTEQLPKWRIDLLVSIYLGFTVIGLLITTFLLQPLKSKGDQGEVSTGRQLSATVRLLVTDVKMALLVPMSLWTGMEQTVLFAEFTKYYAACELGIGYVGLAMICFGVVNTIASPLSTLLKMSKNDNGSLWECNVTTLLKYYAACELGIGYVGLTMICFGVVNTIGSPLSGLLGKYVGRVALCWVATGLNLAVLALMRFWTPSRHETYVFFIIPGVWGLADAIWQTQSGAMVGSIFSSQQEPAYANLRLFQALGFTVAYLYSNHLCEYIKLYISAAVVVIATSLQTAAEVVYRHSDIKQIENVNVQY